MNRRLLFNCLLVAAALATGIAMSLKPWQVFREQRQMANLAEADKLEAEKHLAELTRKKARYESSIGKEELARSQGYRRANESIVEGP